MRPLRADRDGLWLPAEAAGSCEAVFDGRSVWRFDVEPTTTVTGGEVFVPWPASMRPWLNGWSVLEVRCGDRVYGGQDIRFGEGEERISFTDRHGAEVVVDKWGLTQSTFESRGREVTEQLAATAAGIVDLVERECGIQLWMAFGTLLGAIRDGRAIAHDSDLDFLYLSEQATPARMVRELYGIRRALVAAGYSVINKTGSFITVMTTAADGRPASIDIYTSFYLSGLFHATATLRTELPREAILPLGRASFEGQSLPVPADPDRVLAASYGPGWRTPDPSFRHDPGYDVVSRFDSWFGNLMRQRRDWEIYWRDNWDRSHDDPWGYVQWMRDDIPEGCTVVDLGTGRGQVAVALAAAGHEVWALDYARDGLVAATRRSRRRGVTVNTRRLNFYDTRDALTAAAVVAAESSAPRMLSARHLVDAMPPYAREEMWRAAAMLLRGGGRLYLEFDDVPQERGDPMNLFYVRGGRQWPVTLDRLEEEWSAAGLVELRRQRLDTPRDQPVRESWRIVLAWQRQ